MLSRINPLTPRATAPRIAGIANKNENLIAATMLRPKYKLAVIVIPDRDTPGMIAKHCAQPMNKASLTVIFCLPYLDLLSHTQPRTRPKHSDATATIHASLRYISTKSENKKPTITSGSVATKRLKITSLASSCGES